MTFLQTKEWADFQRSLGREVFEYERNGVSAKIIKHDLPLGKNYLYIPHGPEVDFDQIAGEPEKPVADFVKWLRDSAKERKSIFVKAEPLLGDVAQTLAGYNFRKSKKEIQPSKTVIIDLAKSEDELLSAMHHKTRYNIKVAESHGVGVTESDDVDSFLELLKKTAKRDKFNPHPADYYKKLVSFDKLNTKLFLAYIGDRPVAGAIILMHENTGCYLHGVSDYERRSAMAPCALHWHIIKHFKQIGAEHYDMWGIDDRRWPGVTRFKLGWGGETIEYPGAFDLTISQFWHAVYKLAASR